MKKIVIVISILSMALGLSAFDCSSAELTGAKMYIAQKHYDKAKESLVKEVSKNPLNDEAWYYLGYIYGEEDSTNAMKNAFDKSLSVSKKYEKDIDQYEKYMWQTSFNKGVTAFNQAVKATKQDSMKIEFEKAAEYFKTSMVCQPDSIIGYENLVSVYMNLGKHEDALPVLEKLINMKGAPASSYAELGQILNFKGAQLFDTYRTSKVVSDSTGAMDNFSKAIDVLKKGESVYPTDSDILMQLGNAYYSRGELDFALARFKELVEKNPNNKDFHYAYGVVLMKGKDYPAATEQLEKAVTMDEKNTDAIYNLAAAYINWGNMLRDEAVKKESDDKSYQEKFKLAAPYLEKYLSIKPEDSRVWFSLGQVYANMGEKDKAEAAFKKAEQYK